MRKEWLVVLGLCGFLVGCDSGSSTGGSSGTTSTSYGTATDTASEAERTSASTTNDVSRVNTATVEADNTGINKRDRAPEALTPGDQAENEPDRELTRKLRRALTEDDQLSTIAQNIKIITVNGQVTLRGPVANDRERQAIESIAQRVGVTSLNNQLEVKTTNQPETTSDNK